MSVAANISRRSASNLLGTNSAIIDTISSHSRGMSTSALDSPMSLTKDKLDKISKSAAVDLVQKTFMEAGTRMDEKEIELLKEKVQKSGMEQDILGENAKPVGLFSMALLGMNDIPEDAPFQQNVKMLSDHIAGLKTSPYGLLGEANAGTDLALKTNAFMDTTDTKTGDSSLAPRPEGGLLPDTTGLLYMPGAQVAIPEEIVQQFEGYTRKELQEIDQTAVELAHALKVKSIARQPFDTVSKVIQERLKDLPTDMTEFFRAIGMNETRTAKGYMKYLKVRHDTLFTPALTLICLCFVYTVYFCFVSSFLIFFPVLYYFLFFFLIILGLICERKLCSNASGRR